MMNPKAVMMIEKVVEVLVVNLKMSMVTKLLTILLQSTNKLIF